MELIKHGPLPHCTDSLQSHLAKLLVMTSDMKDIGSRSINMVSSEDTITPLLVSERVESYKTMSLKVK